jgi:hypothetical protein
MQQPSGFSPVNRCLECGIDTKTEGGFVNRIPAGRDTIDGYICGPCSSMLDACSDDGGIESDDPLWTGKIEFDDERWETHLKDQIALAADRGNPEHQAYMRFLAQEV